MVVRWWARWCAFGWLALACGPSSGDPGEEGTSEAGDDTSGPGPITAADVDASTAPDPTAADSSTTNTTTSTTATDESESGSESTTGEPASVCDPQPQPVIARLDLDPDTERYEISVDAPCVVETVESPEPDVLRIGLQCTEGDVDVPHVLEIQADPGMYFTIGVGALVHLRAEEETPIDYGGYEHIVMRLEDGTLLAAMMGSTRAPDGVDLSTWFAPFTYELLTDVCELEPYEPPPDGPFIQDPCPTQDRRAAFELTDDQGENAVVHDANEQLIGDHHVTVPWAKVHYPQAGDCPPRPFTSGRFVILHGPTPT